MTAVPPQLDTSLWAAFDAGCCAGGEIGSFAGDCPFAVVSEAYLRDAWLKGFAVGRVEAGIQGPTEASSDR